MEIKIIAYYASKVNIKSKTTKGLMHFNLPDLGIDLRGFVLSKPRDGFYLFPPTKPVFDIKENKNSRFPIFSFSDSEKWHSLLDILKQHAKDFIDTWLISEDAKISISNFKNELDDRNNRKFEKKGKKYFNKKNPQFQKKENQKFKKKENSKIMEENHEDFISYLKNKYKTGA